MHRFYLPPDQTRGDVLLLSEREAHHAARVLRLQPGEDVTVLNGCGDELLCTIREMTRRGAALQVRGRRKWPAPESRITLVQALPKGKSFEWILQKATELGAARIVPLLTKRVVIHLEGNHAAAKVEKWRQVTIEALKQCGAPWLPEVTAPLTLQQFIGRREEFDLALVGALTGERELPRVWFDRYYAEHQRPPARVGVWIGPEGDFTPDEMELIRAGGALPITLGYQVLRVETAAIYCLSVVNYELQSHSPPRPSP